MLCGSKDGRRTGGDGVSVPCGKASPPMKDRFGSWTDAAQRRALVKGLKRVQHLRARYLREGTPASTAAAASLAKIEGLARRSLAELGRKGSSR
jgi:hypothetical protein